MHENTTEPMLDVENITPPATHPLSGEGWKGRVNATTGEKTFQDQHGEYAIDARDSGKISLWDISGEEAERLAEVRDIRTVDAALAVTSVMAEDTYQFTTVDANPELESGVLPGDHQRKHAMFLGRWANGAHMDMGVASYEDEPGEYEATFTTRVAGGEFSWQAGLTKLAQDDPDPVANGESLARGFAKNEVAVLSLMDAFMRYVEVFE